jgi:hypothetical protein
MVISRMIQPPVVWCPSKTSTRGFVRSAKWPARNLAKESRISLWPANMRPNPLGHSPSEQLDPPPKNKPFASASYFISTISVIVDLRHFYQNRRVH